LPGVLAPAAEPAAEVGPDLADPCTVDDGRPMNTNELPRIQPLFELAQRAIH